MNRHTSYPTFFAHKPNLQKTMIHDWKKLQEKFICLMRERVPKNLVNVVMEILPLEKEAVYRRLRCDVAFSFAEMAVLSSHLSISLDNIAAFASPYRSQSFNLHIRDYCKFTPTDLLMSENYIKVINRAADNPYSEFGIAANILPLHISLLHPLLYRVYVLKWRYQFDMPDSLSLNFSNIQIPEKEIETYMGYLDAVQRIKYTYIIWDSTFLLSLINDIKYFHEINLIDDVNMSVLVQEMFLLLETLEQYGDNRFSVMTKNKVEMYISILNFDSTYVYLASENIYVSMNSAYGLGAYTSLERESYEIMKKWIQGLKKTSTLISGTSQLDRMRFFDSQRKLLESHFITRY